MTILFLSYFPLSASTHPLPLSFFPLYPSHFPPSPSLTSFPLPLPFLLPLSPSPFSPSLRLFSLSPRGSFADMSSHSFGDRNVGSTSYDESGPVKYSGSTTFRELRGTQSQTSFNGANSGVSEWKKTNTTTPSPREHGSANFNNNGNNRGEGWRGNSSTSSSDLLSITQSSVAGSVLAARTLVDKVLRYDKSVFLSVHAGIKKSGEQTEAQDILK